MSVLKLLGITFVLIALILFVLVGPYITIWSLNQLFHLGLEYDFKTSMAVIWLAAVLNGIAGNFRARKT